ncbi:MAG: Ribonuclease E [Alphaproteobacteria bacterium MarineAlpha5_Bin5]|mgnify:CR=1 FL=1|nr:MAG: Ribonuclease E [Alphaproteobacteria bacterium MarineAlpha5_Bin5]PPR51146.1 MAG: Ribonuclease E [Alphaproteobacteria bacterium MarineAlpha5_Bin4]
MSKKILIDTSNANETRIAVTNNGKLDDFEIESNKKNAVKGDVYLAKITRVEPSLQAAFVDFGANRNGFLPLTEIHPDYFKIPSADEDKLKELKKKLNAFNEHEEIKANEDNLNISEESQDDFGENFEYTEKNTKNSKKITNKTNNPKREYYNFFKKYKIQEVIKPRQVILVQINKEERGLKGAALTTFLSFAGRYCVLMPNSMNNDGISRKIGDIEERKKLKQILSSVNIPERMSIIIRTAGIGKTKKEIAKDLNFLISQWNKIREITIKSEAPNLIYEEGSILKRIIRDMLNEDIDTLLVEGKDGYDKIKKLTKNLISKYSKKIKLFKSKDNSLFAENNIENQINELFSLSVKLESGGSIVINTTEALVAIDVNSGKNTSERNIESTALKTNLEAASEITRQLRLRDLGGLVVIDFIDMEDYRNNFKVEKAIKTGLFRDRARVQVGRISMFGLLELSRQRLRSSLIDKSFEKCNYCKGSGLILNNSSISDQIIKVIKEKLSNEENLNLSVKCNTALAETLINLKKQEINKLESTYNSNINFVFNDHFSLHEPIVESQKKELEEKKQKNIIKNTKIKTSAKSKSNIKKKTKKAIKKIQRKNTSIKKSKEKTKQLKSSPNPDELKNSDIVEEKSGWWS